MILFRGLLVAVASLIPVTGFSQFERVDEVLSRIEGQFTAVQGFAPTATAENLKGFVKPESIRTYLLWPIEWELEKLETREVLLKEVIEKRMLRLESLSRSIAEINSELLEQGIKDQGDLEAIADRKVQLRLQLSEVGAELAALQSVAAEKAEDQAAKIEVEAAMVVLDRERKNHDLAERRLTSVEAMHKDGLLPSSDLYEQRAKLETSQAAVRLAELDVERQKAKMLVVPGLSDELRQLTVMRERLKAELVEMSADGKRLAELKGLLVDVQRKEFESDTSAKRLAEMRDDLEQLELEKQYLMRVFEKYSKAVAKEVEGEGEEDSQ